MPYNRTYFKVGIPGRIADGLCSTIVAHMSKDGLMFIHPDQRSHFNTTRSSENSELFPIHSTSRTPYPSIQVNWKCCSSISCRGAIGKAIKKYLADADIIRSSANINIRLTPVEEAKKLWNLETPQKIKTY